MPQGQKQKHRPHNPFPPGHPLASGPRRGQRGGPRMYEPHDQPAFPLPLNPHPLLQHLAARNNHAHNHPCAPGKIHTICAAEGIELDHILNGSCCAGGNCEAFQRKELKAMVREMGITGRIDTRGAVVATRGMRRGRRGMGKKEREGEGAGGGGGGDKGKGGRGADGGFGGFLDDDDDDFLPPRRPPGPPPPPPPGPTARPGGAYDMGGLGAALPDRFGADPGRSTTRDRGVGLPTGGMSDMGGAYGAAGGFGGLGADLGRSTTRGRGAAMPYGGLSDMGGLGAALPDRPGAGLGARTARGGGAALDSGGFSDMGALDAGGLGGLGAGVGRIGAGLGGARAGRGGLGAGLGSGLSGLGEAGAGLGGLGPELSGPTGYGKSPKMKLGRAGRGIPPIRTDGPSRYGGESMSLLGGGLGGGGKDKGKGNDKGKGKDKGKEKDNGKGTGKGRDDLPGVSFMSSAGPVGLRGTKGRGLGRGEMSGGLGGLDSLFGGK
ncbi:MAG: hypothetical protein Q9220_005006 [cf. Caloplaca sp. 1 TL-2023]